jgi:NTP pyrophosphatase (non-canonical NTP hydrolase)
MSDQQFPETKPVSFQYELAVLSEECGEVIQIVGKTFRFGHDSYNPAAPTVTNLDLLHQEVGDVMGAARFATNRGLLDATKLEEQAKAKLDKLTALSPPVFHTANAAQVGVGETSFLNKLEPAPVSTGSKPTLSVVSSTISSPTKGQKIAADVIVVALIVAAFLGGSWLARSHAPAHVAASPTIAPAPTPTIERSSRETPVVSASGTDFKAMALAEALNCYKTSIDTTACSGYANMAGRPDLIPAPIKPIHFRKKK